MGYWDSQERERPLTKDEREVKRGVMEDFKQWAAIEEISWRQKSRKLWLREGDKNMVFHKMANARRRRNFLAKLRVDGELLTDEINIKVGVANAFSRIFAD